MIPCWDWRQESWSASMTCSLEMVLQFSDRQDLGEEELRCLRSVFENADVELLNAFFLPYGNEYEPSPKITEFWRTLGECAPGLFDGEHTFEDEIETVMSIIDSDSTLSSMRLGDYAVADIGPWVSGEKKPIGAIAELVLENPVTFRGRVPIVAFEPDEVSGKDYQQAVVEIHAEGIRSLVVLVDLSTEAVAGVEVSDADSFVFVGEPVHKPTPTLEPTAEAMPRLFQPL